MVTSALAWAEFLTGPVDEQGIELVKRLVNQRILPFSDQTAQKAAKLYNKTGRVRHRRFDSLIAATANLEDFQAFAPWGLQLL